MTPEAKKLISKFKIKSIYSVSQSEAIDMALVHLKELLSLPIFWKEKGSPEEEYFGKASTVEHWIELRKELEQIKQMTK
jgi:hypothetical protein